MKKRLLSLLMTAGLLLGLVPAASAAGNSSLVFLDGEVTPQVKLKQGNYTRYIDRFDFGANTYEMEFYQIMEEATDNDGVDDYFIDDKYFDVASFGPDGHLKDDPNSRIQYYSGNFGDGTSYSAIGIPMELECGNLTAKEKGSEALLHFASVYEAFDRDHPEVFWLSRKYLNLQFTHEDSITFCFILWADRGGELFDLRETDYRSENRIKADIARLNQAADGILKGAASCENNYEKILYFNDRLTKTNAYNTIIAEDLDAYDRVSNNVFECLSALTGKSGTEGPACEGYSKALKVLCDRSGIACVLENGTATSILGSGRHMWNSVQVDRNGPWYAVDITWNDPIGRGDAVVSGIESTEWLLVGRNTVLDGTPFRENHVANNNIQGTDVLNGPELSSGACPIYRPAASVSGSVASAAVSSSMGSDMVSQAKSDQSGAVVIAPEGKGSATALEVTIPGATVKQLADSTDADVRLDMVYADLVIPNETLAGFDGKDLTVSVAKTGSGVPWTSGLGLPVWIPFPAA